MQDTQTDSEMMGLCGLDSISTTENYLYPEKDNFTIPDKSVILLSRGRLGNQLFEYAGSYALAKHTNSRLYLFDQECASCYLKQRLNLDTDYYLTKFNLSKDVVIIPYSEKAKDLQNKFFPNDNSSMTKEFLDLDAEYINKTNFYEKIKYVNEKKLIVNGYLIGPNYFKGFEQEIIEQFTIKNSDISNITDILDNVRQNNSICIHFRGTDYLTYKGYIPMDYQKTAIKLIETEKLVENPNYFVITDDIETAKNELQDYPDIEFIRNTTTLEALHILRNCRNNIITSSTFGWWGAFLNQGSDFTIIPCHYHDMFKKNHLTYKIQFQVNNTNKCDGQFKKTDFLIQYLDEKGRRTVRYNEKSMED